eukprot:757681-Hanusia_phi.AAC.1
MQDGSKYEGMWHNNQFHGKVHLPSLTLSPVSRLVLRWSSPPVPTSPVPPRPDLCCVTCCARASGPGTTNATSKESLCSMCQNQGYDSSFPISSLLMLRTAGDVLPGRQLNQNGLGRQPEHFDPSASQQPGGFAASSGQDVEDILLLHATGERRQGQRDEEGTSARRWTLWMEVDVEEHQEEHDLGGGEEIGVGREVRLEQEAVSFTTSSSPPHLVSLPALGWQLPEFGFLSSPQKEHPNIPAQARSIGKAPP